MARSGAASSQTPVRKGPRPRERAPPRPTRTSTAPAKGTCSSRSFGARRSGCSSSSRSPSRSASSPSASARGGEGSATSSRAPAAASGPSVGDAQKKIDKGNLAAYKELAEAYRQDGNRDEAITAGEKYLKARPKDLDFVRTGERLRGSGRQAPQPGTGGPGTGDATTGGATFALPENSRLGRALAPGKIDQELTTAANQKRPSATRASRPRTRARRSSTSRSRRLADDVLLQLLLAQAAYQSRNRPWRSRRTGA